MSVWESVKNLPVRELMTSPVISVAPNALIEDALETMLRHSISGLPVIDEEERLVGIVSEFDTLLLLGESGKDFQPIAPVVHFMTAQVETASEDQTLDDVFRIFARKPVRRLPVVRDGRVVGVISRRDLMRAVRDQRAELSRSAWTIDDSNEAGWVHMP